MKYTNFTFIFLLLILIVITFFCNKLIKLIKFNKSTFKAGETRFITKPGIKLEGIDCIYVITMPQRRNYITEQFDKLGYEVTYFDAIKPSDLANSDYDNLSTINNENSPIYGKITRLPVLLSFIMCFMDSLEKGYSTIMVFEDDIHIKVDQNTLVESINEFNKSNNDIFYMGYCFLNCGQLVNNYKYLVELTDPDLLCCHSICVKTKILPGLIKHCFPMKNNSDEMFRDYYRLNKIKVCVPKQIYFSQNRNELDSLNESIEDPDLFKTCRF